MLALLFRAVAQLVAYTSGGRGVGGSSPPSPMRIRRQLGHGNHQIIVGDRPREDEGRRP